MTEIPRALAEELTATAEALASAAGEAILPLFRGATLETANKQAQGFDPVTAADRASETAMRRLLAQRRPQDSILGEEYGERFLGGFGQARWTGPRGSGPLGTRETAALEEAILFSTFPEVGSPAERAAFVRVAERVRLVRYGMDCYAYALLAAGQIDLVIEAGLYAYDVQAPLAVIEAAGGIMTDWQGGPAHMGGRVLAAANPGLHAAALDLLRDA